MTVRRVGKTRIWLGLCVLSMAGFSTVALATARDQAKKMFDRLTGVPPTAEVLNQMEDLIEQGRGEEAARIAIESSYFYNLGLRNWISAWTNIDKNAMVDLNDYTTTV